MCGGTVQTEAGRTALLGVYPRVCGGTIFGILGRVLIPVYPHVCGGTVSNRGLSPRVRGNRFQGFQGHGQDLLNTVYPRVCGGTPWRSDSFYPLILPREGD